MSDSCIQWFKHLSSTSTTTTGWQTLSHTDVSRAGNMCMCVWTYLVLSPSLSLPTYTVKRGAKEHRRWVWISSKHLQVQGHNVKRKEHQCLHFLHLLSFTLCHISFVLVCLSLIKHRSLFSSLTVYFRLQFFSCNSYFWLFVLESWLAVLGC